MATVMFTFDSHPSQSIQSVIDQACREKHARLKRTASAARSNERRIGNSSKCVPAPTSSSNTHRIVLGQTAASAIQRLISTKRITYAEREVKIGKDRLAVEARNQARDGSVASVQHSRWQTLVRHLPKPGGRFGVPQVNLSPTERQSRVRAILEETQVIVKKYKSGMIPDAERQTIMRRYLGVLGETVDRAIATMDSPLPTTDQLTVSLLKEYGIGVKDLVFHCQIPISELYDAQIITNLDDLATLGFLPQFLGDDDTDFSVGDFVSLFGGSYTVLKDRFGMTLATIPRNAFSVNQLRMLSFNFANDYGTLEDIGRMDLTIDQLVYFGLTVEILTNQFHMDDIRDLSRKLRWSKSDIASFVHQGKRSSSAGGYTV